SFMKRRICSTWLDACANRRSRRPARSPRTWNPSSALASRLHPPGREHDEFREFYRLLLRRPNTFLPPFQIAEFDCLRIETRPSRSRIILAHATGTKSDRSVDDFQSRKALEAAGLA